MQRKTSFPPSLEQLEDRRVLSAANTAFQVIVPPQALALVAQAEATVQQAQAQALQQVASSLQSVDHEEAALQQPALTTTSPVGDSGVPNASRAVGSTYSPATTTSPVGDSGVPDRRGLTVLTTNSQPVSIPKQELTPTQPGAEPAQSVPVNKPVETTQSVTTASAAQPVSVTPVSVSDARNLGNASGSEAANAQTGLTAPPTAQQLERDASATAPSPAVNPSVTTDLAATTATVERDLVSNAGQTLAVAQPAGPSFSSLFSSADGAGSAVNLSSSGDYRTTSSVGTVQFGSGRADESSLEIPVPTLMAADLLNGSAPQDAAALDLGVRQFLGQLDDLGREVTRSLQESTVAIWVSAAALGLITYEVVRRRRRARLALGYAAEADRPADSWVPGLSGPLGSEEP